MVVSGIRGYVGKFGQGKTMSMVWDAIQALYAGHKVYSNFPIDIWWSPPFRRKRHCRAIHVPTGVQLRKLIESEENCIFVVDETAIYFPTKYWDRLTDETIVKFHQVRHYDCAIWYTVQRFKQSVARLRELSTQVVECQKFNLGLFPIFINRFFEPEYFNGVPTAEKAKVYGLGRRIIYPSESRAAWKAFDTKYRIESSVLAEKIASETNKPSFNGLL